MAVSAQLALAFSGGAALLDLQKEAIDNIWIVLGWMAGVWVQFAQAGGRGAGLFLAGAGFPLLLLWPLFLFRMLGAGDLKILSVVGGLLGARAGLRCLALSFLLGAALSLCILIRERLLVPRFLYFFHYIRRSLTLRQRIPYRGAEDEAARIHFAVPVLMGTMLITGGLMG